MFILPKGVIKEVERVCRNYLWGADQVYKKVPYVSWEETCKPKKNGGIGLRNIEASNQANKAKLV